MNILRDFNLQRLFAAFVTTRIRLDHDSPLSSSFHLHGQGPGYRKVIQDLNHRYDPHFDSILHIDRKWRNNWIESDHAALKRLLGPQQSFRSLRSAKATLTAVETIRTIKNGHVWSKAPGVRGEIDFVRGLFGEAA